MAFLMLDKVQAPELIPAVIKSSIRPYALENRLDLDQTLLHYIKVSQRFPLLCLASAVYYLILNLLVKIKQWFTHHHDVYVLSFMFF